MHAPNNFEGENAENNHNDGMPFLNDFQFIINETFITAKGNALMKGKIIDE